MSIKNKLQSIGVIIFSSVLFLSSTQVEAVTEETVETKTGNIEVTSLSAGVGETLSKTMKQVNRNVRISKIKRKQAQIEQKRHKKISKAIEASYRRQEKEKQEQEWIIDLFARAIWNETGILGETSMYYTGSVMLNRVKSSIYPNSLYSVIYQKGQYAITWTGLINRPAPESARRIAKDLLQNGPVLPENVLFQAQFTQGNGTYAKIGNTYYCYI